MGSNNGLLVVLNEGSGMPQTAGSTQGHN